MRALLKILLLLAVLGLAGLAWDVWQLRSLRPPYDRSFAGFLRSGRKPGGLLIDDAGGRLYWIAPPPRTIVRSTEPPVYAFDRSGALVDWTPGVDAGMITGSPVHRRGRDVSMDAVWAWLTPLSR